MQFITTDTANTIFGRVYLGGKKEVKTYEDRGRKTFLFPKNIVSSPSYNTEVCFMTRIPVGRGIDISQI